MGDRFSDSYRRVFDTETASLDRKMPFWMDTHFNFLSAEILPWFQKNTSTTYIRDLNKAPSDRPVKQEAFLFDSHETAPGITAPFARSTKTRHFQSDPWIIF
jgi:hypothetical protein